MVHTQTENNLSSTGTLIGLVADTGAPALLEQPSEILQGYNGGLEELQISRFYQITKRTLDICGALIGLAILLLLLPIIMLLVWWEDRGSVFYQHVRVGQYNRPFI